MNKYKLSIIIPCYNGAEFLSETLDCLQKQTIEDWECIIVNDGSADNSLQIMREYEAKDSRYKVIDKKNEGVSIARNVAIAASSGKYILPLDSDDLIDPTYAEKAIDYLEKHPDVILVYCRAKYFGDRNEEWILPEYNYEELMFGNQIFCSCVYRREDYDKTGGYNPNMKKGLEDWDFLLSLLNKDSKVYQIPEILFFYRKQGDSRTDIAGKNHKDLCNQIVANHINLYSPYLHNVIIGQQQINYLEKELNGLLQSNAYKVGKIFIAPLKWVKNKLGK